MAIVNQESTDITERSDWRVLRTTLYGVFRCPDGRRSKVSSISFLRLEQLGDGSLIFAVPAIARRWISPSSMLDYATSKIPSGSRLARKAAVLLGTDDKYDFDKDATTESWPPTCRHEENKQHHLPSTEQHPPCSISSGGRHPATRCIMNSALLHHYSMLTTGCSAVYRATSSVR